MSIRLNLDPASNSSSPFSLRSLVPTSALRDSVSCRKRDGNALAAPAANAVSAHAPRFTSVATRSALLSALKKHDAPASASCPAAVGAPFPIQQQNINAVNADLRAKLDALQRRLSKSTAAAQAHIKSYQKALSARDDAIEQQTKNANRMQGELNASEEARTALESALSEANDRSAATKEAFDTANSSSHSHEAKASALAMLLSNQQHVAKTQRAAQSQEAAAREAFILDLQARYALQEAELRALQASNEPPANTLQTHEVLFKSDTNPPEIRAHGAPNDHPINIKSLDPDKECPAAHDFTNIPMPTDQAREPGLHCKEAMDASNIELQWSALQAQLDDSKASLQLAQRELEESLSKLAIARTEIAERDEKLTELDKQIRELQIVPVPVAGHIGASEGPLETYDSSAAQRALEDFHALYQIHAQ